MIGEGEYDPEAAAQSLHYEDAIPEDYKIGKYDFKQ